MELTPAEAQIIKGIYSNYHAGFWTPEEALDKLERVINEQDED